MNLRPAMLDKEQRLLFGGALRSARYRTGFSQQGLGQLAWLSQSTISRLEDGSIEGLRYSTLMRIFRALGVVEIRLEMRPHGWYAELVGRYADDTHDEGDARRWPALDAGAGPSAYDDQSPS